MTVPHGETIDRFAVWGKRGDRRIACEMDLMGVNRRSNLTPLGDGEPRGSCTCKVARADCVNCASLLKVASKQLVGSIRFECQPKSLTSQRLGPKRKGPRIGSQLRPNSSRPLLL